PEKRGTLPSGGGRGAGVEKQKGPPRPGPAPQPNPPQAPGAPLQAKGPNGGQRPSEHLSNRPAFRSADDRLSRRAPAESYLRRRRGPARSHLAKRSTAEARRCGV